WGQVLHSRAGSFELCLKLCRVVLWWILEARRLPDSQLADVLPAVSIGGKDFGVYALCDNLHTLGISRLGSRRDLLGLCHGSRLRAGPACRHPAEVRIAPPTAWPRPVAPGARPARLAGARSY